MIRIGNPVPGGRNHVSLSRAQKYVKRGQAQLSADGTVLWMIGHRHLSACRSASLEAELGYDRNTSRVMATISEIRHLPCVKPINLTTNPTKRTIERRPANGKTQIIAKGGIVCVSS